MSENLPRTSSDNQQNPQEDPQNSDQIEQKIDEQISRSIEEQNEAQNEENANIQSSEAEIVPDDPDSLPVPEEAVNEPLEDENIEIQEQGPIQRLFNRVNILRVFNEMIADPDINDAMDTSDDDIDDDDDAGFFFENDSEENELETADESTNQEEDTNQAEDYNNAILPEDINYDTTLPSNHNYLGENFEEISAPKTVNEENDELEVPLLPFPGAEIYWRHTAQNSSNDIQLLPGQIMPLFFYAPLQVQI